MSDAIKKLNKLEKDLNKVKQYFYEQIKELESSIRIYTHLDADGLSSGAILGKTFYRERIPYQIIVLKQLEREEISKISDQVESYNNLLIFSDFGSGQYMELQKQFAFHNLIIFDHHLPQKISSKNEIELLEELHEETSPWHINPYFYGIDGSYEISGAGICYYFSKCLNEKNIDLSPIALVGANGDIQNQGPNKSFTGINSLILEDAKNANLIEVVNDLNFSAIRPLNEALAFSRDINLPGLTNDANRSLKLLQTSGILMENTDGTIKTLNDLNQEEKQKISSTIIEYASVKFNIEPSQIIEKLIINRYLLIKEKVGSELHDIAEFSNLLNACGRTNSASLGIAIAMGDRKLAFEKSHDNLIEYKKLLVNSLSWLFEQNKIQEKEYIQYYFGEDVIPESVIGTITSMLIYEKSNRIDKTKPIFGVVKREDEEVYKISGRANKKLVKKGVNLSQAIRDACKLSNVDVLGGGHPPAAGTKVPVDKIEIFLENCNTIIKKQLQVKTN
ncbi:MAG: DHH family phosphoesterase [Candidatus Hodarchaeota archaeon]